MPESRFDHALHTNEEIVNFLTVGDARGQAWLKTHAEDLEKARKRLESWNAARAQAQAEAPEAG